MKKISNLISLNNKNSSFPSLRLPFESVTSCFRTAIRPFGHFLIVCLFFIGAIVFADDENASVRAFFNSYINAGNAFKSNFFDYYIPNAKIIRVVIKKDGTTESVVVPMSVYKKETHKGSKLGKVIKYKNTYSNINITQDGENYRVTATRSPSPGGQFPAYFIIGKDNNDNWKIKEESLHTDVQKFLKDK